LEHDLSPAFVVINYHSPYGVHKQTLPTLEWQSGGGSHAQGGYNSWSGAGVDADDMIQALAVAESENMPNTVTFDNYIIYTKADAASPALPVRTNHIGINGASLLTGWYAAVQFSFNFFDNVFLPFRVVLLDCQSGGDFGKVLPGAFTIEQNAVITQITSDTNAWSSRAGNRPNICNNVTKTLNEKLRKEYHIT